jgi:hypothetical protein
MRFIVSVFKNTLAKLFVILNVIFMIFVYVLREPNGNQYFHLNNESFLTYIFILVNLPSIIFTSVVTYPIYYHGSPFENSNYISSIQLLCFVATSSLQWVIVGYFVSITFSVISRLWKPKKKLT